MSHRSNITFTGMRLPKAHEKAKGAEIVFTYDVNLGSRTAEETIHASKCYESWQQWGATRDVLTANCDRVESWRRNEFADMGFPCAEEAEEEDAKPVSYDECGSCGHYHRPEYRGDCRNDAERFTADRLDEMHGDGGWTYRDLEEQAT